MNFAYNFIVSEYLLNIYYLYTALDWKLPWIVEINRQKFLQAPQV